MRRAEAKMIAEEVVKLLRKGDPLKDDAFMTSEEVADYLHMSLSHFRHIARSIPRTRVGARYLYLKSAINQVLFKNLQR